MTDERFVYLWTQDKLYVTARRDRSGALTITGQDLAPQEIFGEETTEYEYEYRLEASQVPVVLAGLGAPPDADVLTVLEAQGAELMRTGEERWLKEHGVEFQFWNHLR